MRRLIISAALVSFSLVTLFSFAIISPTTSSAQRPCNLWVPNTTITRHGKVEFTIYGTDGKDYWVRLFVKNVTLNSDEWLGHESTVHGPGSYGQDVDTLNLIGTSPIGENHEFQIRLVVVELNPSNPCTPSAGVIIKVGAEDAVPGPDEPRFTAPPDVINYGFKFIDKVTVVKLPPPIDKEFKIKLGGKWKDDRLREKGGDDKFQANLIGTLDVTSICDNGEALRGDCEDVFRVGEYTMEIVEADNESKVLAKYKFKVEVVLSEAGGPEGTEELKNQVVTPFGIISATPEGLARGVLSLGVGAAGGVAFLLMVFGAYRLMFAGGNPESIQEGRSVITAAIVGLIVVILAVFLLNLIGISILGLDIV